MSQVANLVIMPAKAVPRLRNAAVPRKVWFFGPKRDTCDGYLRKTGKETTFGGSGYCCVMALTWQQEAKQIDLMKSEYGELTAFLSKARQATIFALTPAHREAYLQRIVPESYSAEGLTQFYNDFNEADEPESGAAILEAITWLKAVLGRGEDGKVGLLVVG